MKKIITCLVALFAVALVSGCSINLPIGPTREANSTGGNQIDKFVKEKNPGDNVSTKGALAKNGKLILFIENKNDKPVKMDIEVEFYDDENKLVKSGKDSLTGVRANSEVAIEIYDTPEKYADYKIFVDAEYDDYLVFDKELEMTDNNTGEEVAVQVTNNSEDNIDWISVSVVYYKDKIPVGISEGLESDIKPGRSANFNIGYAYDKNYDDVEFDDYKVFINEAYSYVY